MKISNFLILSFISLGLIITFIGGSLHFFSSAETIEDGITESLLAVAEARADYLENYVLNAQTSVEFISTHSELTQEELYEMLDIDENIYELFVLDSQGKVAVTTNPEEEKGTDFSNEEFFIQGTNNTYIQEIKYESEFNQYGFVISTPFNEGVLVARLHLNKLQEIVSDRTGLGKTGEILVAIQDGTETTFLFERLFENQLNEELNENVLIAEPMKNALFGNELVFTGSLDYRGEPVIAVSQFVKNLDIGLVVKKDLAEVMGIYKRILIRNTLLVSLIVIALSTFMTLIILFKVSKPLNRILLGTKKIAEGNLKHRIKVKSADEIGKLAKSFNEMTLKLRDNEKNTRKQIMQKTRQLNSVNRLLDKKVKEKTKELEKAKSGLDKQVRTRTSDLKKKAGELKAIKRELQAKNKELESTLDDFYTMRLGMQEDIVAGTVEKENQKLKDKLDKLKKSKK